MIRAARRSDSGGLLEALMRLNETGTAADPRFRLRPDGRASLRAHLDEVWFGRFRPFPAAFVAEEDGALVGFVSGEPLPDHPLLDQPPSARIENLWVEPQARRRGLARALVAAFREAAAGAGLHRIEVQTLVRDARAVAFWRSVGFDDLRVLLVAEGPAAR